MTATRIARRIEVAGIVQGVGFRPFVYQLANRLGLAGEVANTSDGVFIHIEGAAEAIDSFVRDLTEHPPPLAHITDVSACDVSGRGLTSFGIASSRKNRQQSTLISPDIAICNDCLKELFSPNDFRYRYPFINCTNCGPRYTIIEEIPYDRPKTSMKHFQMCDRCQAEYGDPADRRFHAQPNACHICGPRVFLYDRSRKKIETPYPIETAAELLKNGSIVAVKGLGGFHLAVDATQSKPVRRLREKKHREEKPFALMSKDIETIRTYARITDEEASLLTSSQRPIVLLRKKYPNLLAEEVSPKNNYFGVMLPYTPLHYLLLDAGFSALVMTSGNLSEEPIAIENNEAFERLGDIAEYFLIHNRDIYLRSDDSIARHTAGSVRLIRRSRGFVPRPVFLKKKYPSVLACGAELKNTICLTKGDKAFLSQHIGDLENLATYDFLSMTADHMKRILDIRPDIIACDLHPDYLSTRYAETVSSGKKKIAIQHHHAHIAGCMAENRIAGPVIGLSFDGTGYGTDGAIWGGEVLMVEERQFTRIAHLGYVPMPGGEAVVKEPWRMAVSYLFNAMGDDFRNRPVPMVEEMDSDKTTVLVEMIKKKVNSPMTSSLGRLFDGVASILGLRHKVHYEGQAAMELEMAAGKGRGGIYDYEWGSGDPYIIQTGPIIRGVVRDLEEGLAPSGISDKFHATIIRLFSHLCGEISKKTGIKQVVLSGGVFQNAILLEGFMALLMQNGFDVYTHSQVPANDGGISLGQAVVAASLA
ncbi:MAG: carbamoyltransferase HypF [Pseudomonadota bacterium]